MASPEHWGPASWAFIHHVAAGYPVEPGPEDVRAYGAFYRSLSPVLPCAACRGHLADNIAALSPDAALAAGRADLFAWTVALHNRVNQQLRKPPISLEVAYKRYFEPQAKRSFGGLTPQTLAALVAVAVAVVVVAVVARSGGGKKGGR